MIVKKIEKINDISTITKLYSTENLREFKKIIRLDECYKLEVLQ